MSISAPPRMKSELQHRNMPFTWAPRPALANLIAQHELGTIHNRVQFLGCRARVNV